MARHASYNHAVSKRRLIAVLVLAAGVPAARPSAQAPSLDAVLKSSARYVADFRKQLAGIAAEETYRQEVVNTGRIGTGDDVTRAVRTLRSDLLLVKPPDADRYVELRDVFEVDGAPVRDRQARLERLLKERVSVDRVAEIIRESARYNIGKIERNINTPLIALSFLDEKTQPRFRFKRVANPTPVFTHASELPINDAPVFRVSTEMWTIEYQERSKNTIIKAPNGADRPAHGRLWIDPSTGTVLISELIIDGGGVIATITVSYQSEPLMGFMVPVEMRESYVRYPERISGRAEYGKFRPIR